MAGCFKLSPKNFARMNILPQNIDFAVVHFWFGDRMGNTKNLPGLPDHFYGKKIVENPLMKQK